MNNNDEAAAQARARAFLGIPQPGDREIIERERRAAAEAAKQAERNRQIYGTLHVVDNPRMIEVGSRSSLEDIEHAKGRNLRGEVPGPGWEAIPTIYDAFKRDPFNEPRGSWNFFAQ